MIFRDLTEYELIRRPVVIMQLDVKENHNIETLLADLKKLIQRRTEFKESTIETPPVNIPIKFKFKTWEWTTNTRHLNHQKYYPEDNKYTITHHLVACYYRMGPPQVAEVFLVSNTAVSLQQFVKYANADFPLKITRR